MSGKIKCLQILLAGDSAVGCNQVCSSYFTFYTCNLCMLENKKCRQLFRDAVPSISVEPHTFMCSENSVLLLILV